MAGVKAQEATVTLADGRELTVTIGNPDMVRWDMTAHKHKWPPMNEAPMLWATFVTWRAATRAGLYSGTWEDWSNTDAQAVHLHGDDEDQDKLDPTPPGPGPDSA